MQWIVEETSTILTFLEKVFPDSSKGTLRSWLEKNRVTINGQIINRANHLINKGEEVSMGKRVVFLRQGIAILYEDDDLVVIEKPAGLLSVADDKGLEESAHALLKKRFNSQRVWPVHRLDRETSGVMVFAYSERAKLGLKELFFHHTIDRVYVGVLEGKMLEKSGTWTSQLKEDKNFFVRSVPEGGEIAITHFEVMQIKENTSTVRFKLETGRKNQIRVHCKDAGHSILGDKKYAGTMPASRLYLHAIKLGFDHPVTGRKILCESPCPQEFSKFL